MFSTFTGNSRRPRNVNLSGQTINPFSNTSWSPAVVSNTTKTVSDAQADREKRQAERQRLKAAGQIQRAWRGHKVRREFADSQRASFDELYKGTNTRHAINDRLPVAFNLLLAFFASRNNDDLGRIIVFVRDCEQVDPTQLLPAGSHPSRLVRFLQVLVEALRTTVGQAYVPHRNPWTRFRSRCFLTSSSSEASTETFELLRLAARIIEGSPALLTTIADSYYSALAGIAAYQGLEDSSVNLLSEAFAVPLRSQGTPDYQASVYGALTFRFLAHEKLHIFENNVEIFARHIDASRLASTVLRGYSLDPGLPEDQLLWLLAHYIDLGSGVLNNKPGLGYLEALHVQLSTLTAPISLEFRPSPELSSEAKPKKATSLDPYVSQRLLSLVDNEGISGLLRDLSNEATTQSGSQGQLGTSLLAGYTSTLLLCFPSQADGIRMRLFLATIPTSEGDIPTTKFLWQDMRRSTVFRTIATESEPPVKILRNYVHGTFDLSKNSFEEREWRVALMFLELYVFVLRLSDDDDFFSAVYPDILRGDHPSTRIRACGLSLEDLKLLSTFLKNACFALHYKARDIMSTPPSMEAAASSRLGSYLSTEYPGKPRPSQGSSDNLKSSSRVSTTLDLGSLRELMTTAMKMLYERDSRKQFLPPGHWLSGKLGSADFITAVIAEYERQREEDDNDSDEDSDEEMEGNTSSLATGRSSVYRPSAHARIESMRIHQKKMARERRLADLGPKLEILKHMPFVVPFETRVNIFRQFISLDRNERLNGEDMDRFAPWAKHSAQIRRGKLFEDAYDNFFQLGSSLKDTIGITFVDQFGRPEPGIDGGGVTKEFLTSVTTETFQHTDKDGRAMFASSDKGLLFPDPTAVDGLREELRQVGYKDQDQEWREDVSNLLKRFQFLGRIVGKCLYEGILLDISFAGFFLLQWSFAGSGDSNTYKGSVNDLRDLDEELYKGMLRLKDYPGDVSELGLDFTIDDQVSGPGQPHKTVTRNLIPNGDKTIVTNDNRLLYISYVARHRLVQQSSLQTRAFLQGLREIIRPSWLSMFNQSELQRLVGGDSSEIDLEDLRRNTVYSGLYVIGDDNEEHPTIKHFWNVMRGFTDAQRRDVIKYVSSTPRAPLLGFSQLNPKFSIRDSGRDESRLPSTSTCMNLLKLPIYTSEEVLKEKLLYAVTSGAGFDLS